MLLIWYEYFSVIYCIGASFSLFEFFIDENVFVIF